MEVESLRLASDETDGLRWREEADDEPHNRAHNRVGEEQSVCLHALFLNADRCSCCSVVAVNA